MIARGTQSAPYAFVIPREQTARSRSGGPRELLPRARRAKCRSRRSTSRPTADVGSRAQAIPSARRHGIGARRRYAARDARRATCRSTPATGSFASISRTRRRCARCSRFRNTAPTIRRRTTTPVGRSTSCGASRRIKVADSAIFTRPMRCSTADATVARRPPRGSGRDAHRAPHRRLALRRAFRGRPVRHGDGRRQRVHRRRRDVSCRDVHHRDDNAKTRERARIARRQRPTRSSARSRAARTRSRCRASRSCTRGSRRRTRVGYGSRSIRWACRTRTSRTRRCASRTRSTGSTSSCIRM